MAKVTRDDVARLAGTSTAVVSYVINNGPRPVAPATRERVLAAIKQLGYRPDRVAQAMASRRTDLIGMIVPDARQPFFAEMAHAVEQAAAERGKMVLVGNSDYRDEREVHYLRAFLGMRVSGLILVSQGPSERAAAEIEAWDARVVLLHERPEAIDDVAVVTDDVGGAQLATRHLLEHGHPYVACLGGTEETPSGGGPGGPPRAGGGGGGAPGGGAPPGAGGRGPPPPPPPRPGPGPPPPRGPAPPPPPPRGGGRRPAPRDRGAPATTRCAAAPPAAPRSPPRTGGSRPPFRRRTPGGRR